MKTIIMVAEKADTGYSAYLEGIDGIITVGDNLTELRINMQESIDVFVDACKEFNEEIPEELRGEYSLKLKLDLETFFEWLTKAMTQKGLSQIAGMNESLISQYSTGVKKPGQKQLKRIETALHQFADDLQAISF